MRKTKEQKQQAKQNRQMIMRTLKFMLRTARREKPSLYFAYILLFIAELSQKLQTIIIPKFLFDELMLVINGAPMQAHMQNIILCVALICGITFLADMLSDIAFHCKMNLSEWFNEYFDMMLSKHTMNLDFELTEDPDALDQLNRAKEGISWYSGGVVGILDTVYNMILNITILGSVSTIIAVTCPLLLPVQFAALVLMALFNDKINKAEVVAYGRLAKLNRIFGYYMDQIADFSYGKEIRLYDSAGMMNEKSRRETDKTVQVWSDNAKMQRKYHSYMNLVNALRDGFSYFYIGLLALLGKISIGDFSMCVASASALYHGIHGVTNGIQQIEKGCIYASEFMKFMEYPSVLEKGIKEVSGETHTIEFVNVSFKYPRTEKYVLKDINLKITSGEHLSVVGLNGAGKTTFIKLLCRLYEVTDGAILIDGVNIKEYSQEEYRKLFAVVFQDFKLFAFSLRENIALGEEVSEEEIQKVLEMAGLSEDAKKLPEGLDTILYKSFDEKGTELSGGQQQKTAIARALRKNAPIVILDEPTAALDPVAEYDIYRQFDNLVGNKTAIYISHRLSSCKFCHHIAVFAENTIKEYGTHDELVNRANGIYAEMFAAQAQYYL